MRITLRHWLRAMLIGLGLAGAASVQAQSCVTGSWVSPPNTLWDSVNGSFPVQAESARFQIRWPSDKPTLLTPQQAQTALEGMEAILNWFTGPTVKWPEPFCDTAVKYKFQIFTNNGYGLSGAGAGDRAPAMWVDPGALIAIGLGETSGMVHEFTHSMQFHSKGMRDTQFGGWLWESHAEFMAHQYPGNPDKTGCSMFSAWQPHLYYGSTRLRYCNWQFWDHLKNKYGFSVVNDLFVKTSDQLGQDPFAVLMRNQGWSPAQLGDEFGQYAMRNVTWDYVDAQDGFNRGALYRIANGPITDLGPTLARDAGYTAIKRLRVARLEPIDPTRRRFVVSKYFAPQRYGYNVVKLVPDAGATSVTVNFNGVVQKTIAAGAELGTGAFQPGAAPDWTTFTMPTNPASNWRWGVVAIDQSGNPRYSPMQRGATASLRFALQAGDTGVYLVVAATPDEHHGIFWDQMYHTLYRYPYKVELAGAVPDGFQPGYQPDVAQGYPAGTRHPNGGGWVANGAVVEPTAYVGPNAAVLGGQVLGSARIEDYAVLWNGTVRDNAVVGGLTPVNRSITVADNARVHSVLSNDQLFDDGTVINGNAILFGDLETHLGTKPVSQGAFSGVFGSDQAANPDFGANRTRAPVEVTAPVPPGWPNNPPAGYTLCAAERAQCSFTGTATVVYGSGTKWTAPRSFTTSVTCSNATFGDPTPLEAKSCYYATVTADTPPAGFTRCASEGTQCGFTGAADVVYGARSAWTAPRGFTNGVSCRTASFGTDPAPFVVKSCYYRAAVVDTPPAGYTRCASEGAQCAFSGQANVVYGARSSWSAPRPFTGGVACRTASFGVDPAPFVAKSCYYRAGS